MGIGARVNLVRFTKFGVIGGSVAVIGAGLLYILVEKCRMEQNLAYAIQTVVSLQLNFFLNDRFTWTGLGNGAREWVQRWLKFHAVKLLSIAVNQLLFTIFTAIGMHYLLVYTLSVALVTVVNYTTNDRFVFAPSRPG